MVIVTAGQPSQTSFQTVCGFTPAYISSFAPVPAYLPPDLAGVVHDRLYSAQPIPAGTRLGLTAPLCIASDYLIYNAVVLKQP